METKLGQWAESRAGLFRYVSELLQCKDRADAILLSGDVSALMAGVLSRLYPAAGIYASADDADVIRDARSEYKALKSIDSIRNNFFDIAVSLLQIQSLNTRELTPYLFDLYDSLRAGGVLMLSFPEAAATTVIEKNLFPSWYDQSKSVYMKYYMSDDVVRALGLIGFDIRAIERDPVEELYSVVTIIAAKR